MIVSAIDPNLWKYVPVVILTVALVIAIPWAIRTIREARGEVQPDSDNPDDILGPLAEAFAAGQMSEEEYNRIRSSIERDMGEPSLRYKYSTKPKTANQASAESDRDPPTTHEG